MPASTCDPRPVAIGAIRPVAAAPIDRRAVTLRDVPGAGPAPKEATNWQATMLPPTPAQPPRPEPTSAENGAPSAAPEAAELGARRTYAPGDVLDDRYRLVGPIGSGGMGSVWRARNLGLDLDVALKLVRSGCWVPKASERLLREARAAARVAHPAAVRVFDFGVTSKGDPFFVMELLQGRPLSRALADAGPIAPLAAVQLVLPVTGALIAAHREGIVHRDVKPANVLLVEDGRRLIPKLIDFGIACAAASAWAKKLTANDIRVGSPAYMAPEQLRGGAGPDPRTDVWGVCFMLYELITGAHPGRGLDVLEPLQATARAAVLADHATLARVIARGLASSPEDRWPTMRALGSALAEWALRAGAVWDITRTSLAVYCSLPALEPEEAWESDSPLGR